MYQFPIFRGNNRIQPSVILPSNNFFRGNNRQNAFLTQRYNYETTNTNVQPVCTESPYLYKLGSNIVYVGKCDDIRHTSSSFCAELGSQMRPTDNLSQAIMIIQQHYSRDTPVTISFAPGNYTGTSSRNLTIPKNVVGLVCTQGSAKIKCNLLVKNLEKLDIQNIDLYGNVDIIADGNHKGKIMWNNGNLYGTYKYTVTDEAVQWFTLEKVDQFVSDDMDGVYDNEIIVTGKGNATVHKVNCVLESKFKGKVDVSETGTFNRYTEKCTVTSGGETTDLSGNGVMDDCENQNKTYHVETDQKDYWILNLVKSAKIRWEKNKSTHQGEFGDGFFWYNVHGQDETVIEKIHDSCVYKIEGLGGFLSLYGKDQCKIIVRKQNDVVEASTNKELRPLYVRNLSDSCSLDQKISNTKFSTASHYYENIQNGDSEFLDHDDRVEYIIAGNYCTNNDKSSHHSTWERLKHSCDPEIGFMEKIIMNDDSSKTIKLSNSNKKLCNNGINAIYNLEQKDNTNYTFSDSNSTCDFTIKNSSTKLDEKKKPCVRSEVISDFSKYSNTSKSNNTKLVAGPNCDGIRRSSLNGECKSSVVEYDENYQMVFEDDNAIAFVRDMNDNSKHDFIGNTHIIDQTGGHTLLKLTQNGNSQYKRDHCQLNLNHKSNENSKTIDEIMNENASSFCTENLSIEKSDGTLYSLTTNGNSSANSKRKNGNYSGKKQTVIRQTNDKSTQSVRADGVESDGILSYKGRQNQNNVICNGNDHKGVIDGENINLDIVNSTIDGTIDVKQSTVGMKECTMKGSLHAVNCDNVESLNCLYQGIDNTCPIILENSKTCNFQLSKIETTASTPHIQTKTDENCKLNLKGVNFSDTTGENSSLACIETDGKGETICEVGTCSSKRSKFLSATSEQDGKSKTTFSRNCQFGIDGLDPTVDGEVIETSASLVVQNGSLVSSPEDDCGPKEDESSIQIIPRITAVVPIFTMYYCLALPQYDYFVSSSISFKDIIDSYQSKEEKSGCFTATSVRCMTNENCVPMDGIYIMIDGIRTPNDQNALQTDKNGNIIDRNIKDPLFMEKYHITKIDPNTKRSVAQLGGNLQYTDGSGTGSTTCIPRLIFPIHYASGEWSHLQNGYIEWNYDNRKETDYKRELRFFT